MQPTARENPSPMSTTGRGTLARVAREWLEKTSLEAAQQQRSELRLLFCGERIEEIPQEPVDLVVNQDEGLPPRFGGLHHLHPAVGVVRPPGYETGPLKPIQAMTHHRRRRQQHGRLQELSRCHRTELDEAQQWCGVAHGEAEVLETSCGVSLQEPAGRDGESPDVIESGHRFFGTGIEVLLHRNDLRGPSIQPTEVHGWSGTMA